MEITKLSTYLKHKYHAIVLDTCFSVVVRLDIMPNLSSGNQSLKTIANNF